MIKKIVLSAALLSSSLMAESFFKDSYSLLAIEGGMSTMDIEKNAPGTSAAITQYDTAHAGLKIGAQSDDFRVFLSGRYYSADDFDYMTTYGVDIQYMLNFSSAVNLYMGVGTGLANMRFVPQPINGIQGETCVVSEQYYNGDLGFNIHLGESVDLELGGRIMSIDATNTIDSVSYNFDNVITGYASVIYKFKMD